MQKFPKIIPVFPISNFIIFPKTTVPLNIFEPRYLEMVDNSMSSNKYIGMIQPKKQYNSHEIPELHNIGCLGKIVSFNETNDGRYLIELKGILRFKTIKEIKTLNQYREYEVDFSNYTNDLYEEKEKIKFSDLELIFKDLKSLFERRGFIINWKQLEKQSLDETINALQWLHLFHLRKNKYYWKQKI